MTKNFPSDPTKSPKHIGPIKGTELVPDREANLPEDSELFIRKTFETDPQKGCELLYRLYY